MKMININTSKRIQFLFLLSLNDYNLSLYTEQKASYPIIWKNQTSLQILLH